MEIIKAHHSFCAVNESIKIQIPEAIENHVFIFVHKLHFLENYDKLGKPL